MKAGNTTKAPVQQAHLPKKENLNKEIQSFKGLEKNVSLTKSCLNTANSMQVLLLSLRHFITSVCFFFESVILKCQVLCLPKSCKLLFFDFNSSPLAAKRSWKGNHYKNSCKSCKSYFNLKQTTEIVLPFHIAKNGV